MKKKISLAFLFSCTVTVLLAVVLLCTMFFTVYDDQMKAEVRRKAEIFEKSLNYSADNLDYVSSLRLAQNDMRLSIIDVDGKVLFDSYANIDSLDNHMERPEVQAAFEQGRGESVRFSDTLGSRSYYYAVKLSDDTVLRLAESAQSIYGVLFRYLPLVCLIVVAVLLVTNIMSAKLTKHIIAPINNIDLESPSPDCYDELAPFIRKIDSQKQYIAQQIQVIEDRATTTSAIIQNMSEGIVLTDAEGKIASINDSAIKVFQVKAGYVGQNISFLTRNRDIHGCLEHAMKGQGGELTVELDNKSYSMIFSPVQGVGCIILIMDITQKAENERIRREFTANVSHELKTPLTAISGYAEIINGGLTDKEKTLEFAGKIQKEAGRLVSVIEDIIRLSELEEKPYSESVSVDIADIARQTVDSLKDYAAGRQVAIKTQLSPCKLAVNPRILEEIFYNLIDNAIKYNKEGGSVTVAVQNTPRGAEIKVSDTGIGIPKDQQDRVFERFYTVDKSRSKKTGGTGLGLSIVKHGVAYHNGKIEMDSSEGKGTTMTVVL